jgi:hypothetical protein
MSRLPRKKPFSLTIDLLGDGRPWSARLPAARTHHDWRFFGTVTYNGETGALAWRGGDYGIATGEGPVRPFGLWERIRINEIMEFESPPGRELAPRLKPSETWGSFYFSGA